MMSDHDGYVPIKEDTIGADDDWEDQRGIYASISEIKVEDLPKPIQQYLNKRVKNRRSKNTWYNHRASAKHWVAYCVKCSQNPEMKDVDVLSPTVVNMEDFIDDQLDAGYSNSSLRSRVYDLSAMFTYLSKREYAEYNPVSHDDFELDLEAGDSFQDIRYITKETFEKILAVVEKPRDRLILCMLWDTGVRSEELVSIYISDLDRDEQKITIKTGKQQGEREKDRVVFYTRRTEKALKEYLDHGGRKSDLGHEESPYLFIGDGSMKLNERRPTELVREYAEKAGVQAKTPTPTAAGHYRRKVTAHCFRHSFAVLRVKRGMPIVYLSDLLGHEDVDQTRIYLRFRDDDLKEAYRKYRP